MLQEYTDQVYKSGIKDGVRKLEHFKDLLPLILRLAAFLLAVFVLIQPLAILFLVYPITDIVLDYLNKRHATDGIAIATIGDDADSPEAGKEN